MARALLRHGVTSFLPTALSLPAAELPALADRVHAWMPAAPADGAEPLGFNREGPFLAPACGGAHDPSVPRRFGVLACASSGVLDAGRVPSTPSQSEGLDRRFGFRRRTVPSGRPEVRETPLRPASPAHSRDPAGAPGALRRPARWRHPRRAGLGRWRSARRRSSVHQDRGRVDQRQRRPHRCLD